MRRFAPGVAAPPRWVPRSPPRISDERPEIRRFAKRRRTVAEGPAGTREPPAPGTREPPAPGTREPPAPGTREPPAPGTREPPAPGTREPPAPGARPRR